MKKENDWKKFIVFIVPVFIIGEIFKRVLSIYLGPIISAAIGGGTGAIVGFLLLKLIFKSTSFYKK